MYESCRNAAILYPSISIRLECVVNSIQYLYPFFMVLHRVWSCCLMAFTKMKGTNWLKSIKWCHQGRSLVNNFSLCNNLYKRVVLSLIWLHSLVCQIHNKQMSQLVAYSGNICVRVVSCDECGGWQLGRRSASMKKAMLPMASFMKESRSNVVAFQ